MRLKHFLGLNVVVLSLALPSFASPSAHPITCDSVVIPSGPCFGSASVTVDLQTLQFTQSFSHFCPRQWPPFIPSISGTIRPALHGDVLEFVDSSGVLIGSLLRDEKGAFSGSVNQYEFTGCGL